MYNVCAYFIRTISNSFHSVCTFGFVADSFCKYRIRRKKKIKEKQKAMNKRRGAMIKSRKMLQTQAEKYVWEGCISFATYTPSTKIIRSIQCVLLTVRSFRCDYPSRDTSAAAAAAAVYGSGILQVKLINLITPISRMIWFWLRRPSFTLIIFFNLYPTIKFFLCYLCCLRCLC